MPRQIVIKAEAHAQSLRLARGRVWRHGLGQQLRAVSLQDRVHAQTESLTAK